MKKITLLGLLLPLLLCISCGDDDNSELPVISLDQTEITFEYSGGEIKVKLTANSNWSVNNIPDWLSLDFTSGSTSKEITIIAKRNENIENREVKIIFTSDNKSVALNIFQEATSKFDLTWSSLGFSSFNNFSFVLGENSIERIYSFKIGRMFVNPNLDSNTDISEYEGYTFNEITVFPLTGIEKSKSFIPSKIEQDAFTN